MNHRTSHLLVGCVLLLLARLASPAPAQACKCAPQSVEDAARDAAAVFEGYVKAIAEADGVRTVRLSVVRVFRGETSRESYELRTRSESAACGVAFEPERSYLVYATLQDGVLWAHGSGRTRPMSEAGEDLAVLGMGITPFEPTASDQVPVPSSTVAPVRPAPARGGCASCSVGAAPQSQTPTSSMLGWAFAVSAVLGARLTCRRRYRSRP